MKINELTNILAQRQVPQMALIVYKNNQTNAVYMESHQINKRGEMLAGKPLTRKCITELVESFSAEQAGVPHGKIPPNMLWCNTRKGGERYLWYNPPRKRMMFFAKSLNIKSGEYHLPGIIYDTGGEMLNLYAFRGEKPEADTRLYKAPFFNVTGKNVCLGNADITSPDNPTFEEYLLYWEKKFWLTEFSHLGGSKNPTKSNLVAVTKKMTLSFDYSELIPFEKNKKSLTVNDLLK
jgi:PRTRC genetic system protein B